MAAVTMIRVGKRYGYACAVCRSRELFDSAAEATAARKEHVATPPHRSSLRAARRE